LVYEIVRVCLPGTTLRILNWRVPELLPTNPTLRPPEHVGQFKTNALPVSVLLHDSASYVVHAPGVGVEFGVHDALGVPVALGLGVPVGGGHPGVEVGVALGVPVGVALGVPVAVGLGVPAAVGLGVPVAAGLGVPVAVGLGVPVGVGLGMPRITGTQRENSDVLPLESVAVAVIT
jgi:hypothetical protein